MTAADPVRTPLCPICGGAPQTLLSLDNQPIYQHPVPAEAVVPGPYTVDLSWVRCEDCAHAWQAAFDAGLLESIYRSHYYTPAPDGLARQFRDDFISALEAFGLIAPRSTLLEIGASDGDVLEAMKARTGARHAYAFEPNGENAVIARSRGLEVHESFFDGRSAQLGMRPSDLIYARHVIEHVFQFANFFAGINAAATPGADLILETPSLIPRIPRFLVALSHRARARFFAALAGNARSTVRLDLRHHVVTAEGNLIAAFRRSTPPATAEPDLAPPRLEGLQAATNAYRSRLRELVDARRLVFWGAGSAGIGLARIRPRAGPLDGRKSQ